MLRIERRYLDRFKIYGAKIKYVMKNGDSSTGKLIDITKISVRFTINHNIIEGDSIEISILIKGKKPINVIGNVIWTAESDAKNDAQAVVQFLPFGTDDRYNSMESYEQLAQLEEEYSQELKILNNIYKA